MSRLSTFFHVERYAYYTRRGFDFSPNYGSDPSSGTFTPRFHSSCRRENTVTCILDGEMVAWNVEGSFIVSKGEHVDVKSLAPTGRLIPCFFAFDILLLNGEIVTNRPFRVIVVTSFFFGSIKSFPLLTARNVWKFWTGQCRPKKAFYSFPIGS